MIKIMKIKKMKYKTFKYHWVSFTSGRLGILAKDQGVKWKMVYIKHIVSTGWALSSHCGILVHPWHKVSGRKWISLYMFLCMWHTSRSLTLVNEVMWPSAVQYCRSTDHLWQPWLTWEFCIMVWVTLQFSTWQDRGEWWHNIWAPSWVGRLPFFGAEMKI